MVYNGVINFNEKVKIDIVDPVNNQNPISDSFFKVGLTLNLSVKNKNFTNRCRNC